MQVPSSTPAHQQIDSGDIRSIERQMIDASEQLAGMSDVVAKAKQVKEWDSERRKAALSCQVAPLLDSKGVGAAEHIARASKEYHEAMRKLQLDLYDAEKALASYEAVRCKWESARSILSMAKHLAGNL